MNTKLEQSILKMEEAPSIADQAYVIERFNHIAETFVNTNHLEKDELLQLVYDSMFSLIPEAQKGSFYERDGQYFKPIYARGYDLDLLNQLKFHVSEAFIDFESEESQLIDAYEVRIHKRDDSIFDANTIAVFKALGTYENFTSLYAPIKFNEKKIGLICIENFKNQSFSETSKLYLKVYAQLVSNYYGLKIHKENETKKLNEIISALVTAIEVKDHYTVGHAKRVAEYSVEIAKRFKLPSAVVSQIETAAVLHDVGKIGIPTNLLNKPGKLSDEEFDIVKRHALDTKKILESISDFEEVIAYAALHHEHYDGSGYPNGLAGEAIPFPAQIIQAADALDAMTTHRSYRNALDLEQVKAIFMEQRGKQFHPDVADEVLLLISRMSF